MREDGLRFDVGPHVVADPSRGDLLPRPGGLGQVWLPVQRNWRLNERHYGALQGLDKKETTERHGPDQV